MTLKKHFVENPGFAEIMQSVCDHYGMPTDWAFDELESVHRRLILFGDSNEEWIPLTITRRRVS